MNKGNIKDLTKRARAKLTAQPPVIKVIQSREATPLQLLDSPEAKGEENVAFSFDREPVELEAPSGDYLEAPSYLSTGSPRRKSNASVWTELQRLSSSRPGSADSRASTWRESATPELSSAMSARLRHLVRKFEQRTERFRELAVQPPTPSTGGTPGNKSIASEVSATAEDETATRQRRLGSFIPLDSRLKELEEMGDKYVGFGVCRIKVPRCFRALPDLTKTIDPQSKIYLAWLWLVTLAFTYNAVTFILRPSFRRAYYVARKPEQTCRNLGSYNASTYGPIGRNCTIVQPRPSYPDFKEGIETDENRMYWWLVDYTCDLLYLLDIIAVKHRLCFINNGEMERDPKETLKNYVASKVFLCDVLSLLPLDLFYLIPAAGFNALVRFPRLAKIFTFWEFYDRMDQSVSNAHVVRILRTMTYMLYLIHVEACGYYAISAYEGLLKNEWVYDGNGTAYVRCMYLATKTATSIGNNPKPTNTLEYIFMIVYWLSGVFVFAMLIGQIRDIFQSANAAKTNYSEITDKTSNYLQSLNVPQELQKKVRTWFTYNWDSQKTLDEMSLLEALPKKMKTDLAIHVHFGTLSKVKLFQDCDKNLLYDLVLKLRPVLFLPGDYICRKGEVGTEMYIVMSGFVEVVGGPQDSIVFATLKEGSVFGEISLLALSGGNRRTAHVRAKGFAQLFILSKFDFEEAMEDHPEAHKILQKKAKKLLAQNAARDQKKPEPEETEEIIKSKHGTPKLLKTLVQMVRNKSKTPLEVEQNDDDEEDDILVVQQTETVLENNDNEENQYDEDEEDILKDIEQHLQEKAPKPIQNGGDDELQLALEDDIMATSDQLALPQKKISGSINSDDYREILDSPGSGNRASLPPLRLKQLTKLDKDIDDIMTSPARLPSSALRSRKKSKVEIEMELTREDSDFYVEMPTTPETASVFEGTLNLGYDSNDDTV